MNRQLSRSRGITRIEVVVIVVAGALLLACALPALARLRQLAFRADCRNNLAVIGKAMLTYANDHGGTFPSAGEFGTLWGGPVVWNAPDASQAFPWESYGRRATISSSLYLLVKYGQVAPETFVCKGDAGTIPFRLSGIPSLPPGFTLANAWDFGPDAYRHCSYSYHNPYNIYVLSTSCEPRMAVAADRNPWIESPAADAMPMAEFTPDLAPFNGSAQQARKGNAICHQSQGQNVLFLDGSASFQKRAYCGVDNDNIYTVSRNLPGHGDALGLRPLGGPTCIPWHRKDSVLVHDPRHLVAAPYREVAVHEKPDLDSKDLRQTAVVATLDCPLPEHGNAIWCSTFQMAWDKLKADVIGEAIQVREADDLADRLNRGQFPARDIEEKSYYAVAGFVKNGVIEQIQQEMRRRFPSEPVPEFDRRYKTLPDVIVGYAYLSMDAGFKYPFYTYLRPFAFTDSTGMRTDVTAFRSESPVPDPNAKYVREQVDILYYRYGDSPAAAEFAVDLSRHTSPYQVILARMPHHDTLGQALQTLNERIAEFRDDPDYKVLCKLRGIDTMIVPDVLFKLTHHFEELRNKFLRNSGWQEHFFFEIMQRIDFTLSRTGVILKSEARIGSAASAPLPRRIEEPRHLHFDEPFLICVKKRQADATPFFIMWVDNAELLKGY